MTMQAKEWTMADIIQGVKDAAAFCDCSRHPDATEWASACRLAAVELEKRAGGEKVGES